MTRGGPGDDISFSRRSLVAVAGSAALAAAWLALLYSLSWRAFPGHSDDANAVLAGAELVRGNVLLRGWTLPADTYWSIDLPLYGLYSAWRGVGPAAMRVVPTGIAAAVTVLAAALAGQGRSGADRRMGAVTAFLLLGLPAPLLATFFLQGPHHVATTLFCLAAFALLRPEGATRRAPRREAWGARSAGVALLAAAVVGDPFALLVGVAPLFVAGVLAAIRAHRPRAGAAPCVGALLAMGAALAANAVLGLLGAHAVATAPGLSPARAWATNLWVLPRFLSGALGAGPGSGLGGLGAAAHALGAAVLAYGLLASLFRLVVPGPGDVATPSGEERWLDDVLTWGFLGGVVAYVLASWVPPDVASVRYLLPCLVYAAVLAGRRVRWPRSGPRARALALAVLVLIAGVYVAVPLRRPPAPADPTPARQLAAWLANHDLEYGLGAYWDASIVTVESAEGVAVRPVIAIDGRLHALAYYSSVRWYTPEANPAARFLVFEPGAPWGGVDERTAVSTFGPPWQREQVGQYRVLVWDHDLLPGLGPPGP